MSLETLLDKLQNLNNKTGTHIGYKGAHFITDEGYVTDFNNISFSGCRPCFGNNTPNINGPVPNFSGLLINMIPLYNPVFNGQIAISRDNRIFIRNGNGNGGSGNWNSWREI